VQASLASETEGRTSMGTGRVLQRLVTLKPEKKGIYLMTRKIYEEIPELKNVQAGTANLFLKSTDAALTINENADPTVRTDMEGALERIASSAKSPEDAARAKTSLVGVSLDVPIHDGKFGFGTWQGLYLCDFTGQAGEAGRELVVTITKTSNVRDTKNITVKAPSRGCHLVTDRFEGGVPGLAECKVGLLNFCIRHTSASLSINENADPTVRTDMEAALNRIVPESWNADFFEHTFEGPDDMPAHVKSTIIGASYSVPIKNGRLQFGTWQGLYLNEHRDVGGFGGGHSREVTMTLQNAEAVQKSVTLTAPSRGCHDVTAEILKAVSSEMSKIKIGVVNCFIQHTSASLTVNDMKSGACLEAMLNNVVPERWNDEFFQHTYEGPDDMPGHVKSTLMGVSLSLPITDGQLALAANQAIFLCEHRNGRSNRTVVITVQGI